MKIDEQVFDLIVIGSGAAGLSLSELASRNGKKTCLIEKEHSAFSAASREHHGWFHMGSLYSILSKSESSEALLKNIYYLLVNYSCFENMNLNITKKGELQSISSNPCGWFTGDNIDYLVACHNDEDLIVDYDKKNFLFKMKSLTTRVKWHFRVRKFVQRHSRFHNFKWKYNNLASAASAISKANFMSHSREVIRLIDHTHLNLNKNTHISVSGFDQTIRAPQIGMDLFNSFLASGGEFINNTEAYGVTKLNDLWQVSTNSGNFVAKNMVMCTGKWNQHISINGNFQRRGTNILSPLLVVHPKIHNKNFVRMTPVVGKTINHIKHSTNGIEYSVIGGGHQLSEDSSIEERKAMEKSFRSYTEEVFNVDLSNYDNWIYWGTKTEDLNDQDSRNYKFMFKEVSDRLWNALPGKFSLCFSLAVNGYKEIFGSDPDLNGVENSSHSKCSSITMLHAELVENRKKSN